MTDDDFLAADWPAPANIHAGTSCRNGGVSQGSWRSLNLGRHTGDDPAAVAENRARLRHHLDLPAEPAWLKQVHGVHVVAAETAFNACADAAWTAQSGVACTVLTADCLPVLLCDRAGRHVAAAHAGWRGLVAGILSAAVQALPVAPRELLAWLGPAIGPAAFEVGPEVPEAFARRRPGSTDAFVPAASSGKFLGDLPALARAELAAAGVEAVYGGGWCTVSDPDRFFSYRRDGVCGRMATLVWRD